MKKTILAAAFAIAGAIALPAQTMSADIPFDFSVPGAQLPAGKYLIERSNFGINLNGYNFRAVDSTKSHFVPAPVLKSAGMHINSSHLVFRCEAEGERCQLTEIQSAYMSTRAGVPASIKNRNHGFGGTEIAAMFVEVAAK